MELDQFQRQTRLKFADVSLLQQAMTHRSYVNEHDDPDLIDNERLEFFGDAILGFVVGEMLFDRFPTVPEGGLTRLRAALVSGEALAGLARQLHVGETLRMGRGEEASGGRERANNLAGAFEALVGAVYRDKGLDAVRRFVVPQMTATLEQVLAEQSDKDARSLLQEWSQARHNLTPMYRTVSETGPDHEKEFTVEVLVGDQVVGVGIGRSKQSAAQSAARDALRRLPTEEAR